MQLFEFEAFSSWRPVFALSSAHSTLSGAQASRSFPFETRSKFAACFLCPPLPRQTGRDRQWVSGMMNDELISKTQKAARRVANPAQHISQPACLRASLHCCLSYCLLFVSLAVSDSFTVSVAILVFICTAQWMYIRVLNVQGSSCSLAVTSAHWSTSLISASNQTPDDTEPSLWRRLRKHKGIPKRRIPI